MGSVCGEPAGRGGGRAAGFPQLAAAGLGYELARRFFPHAAEAVSIPGMTILLLLFVFLLFSMFTSTMRGLIRASVFAALAFGAAAFASARKSMPENS